MTTMPMYPKQMRAPIHRNYHFFLETELLLEARPALARTWATQKCTVIFLAMMMCQRHIQCVW
jgi:hypothetical protein